jgi:hypothetical protein
MNIITAGQIFLLNYELSRFRSNQVNLYEFFFLGTHVQTKIRNTAKFWINQVLLYQ